MRRLSQDKGTCTSPKRLIWGRAGAALETCNRSSGKVSRAKCSKDAQLVGEQAMSLPGDPCRSASLPPVASKGAPKMDVHRPGRKGFSALVILRHGDQFCPCVLRSSKAERASSKMSKALERGLL